MAFTGKYELESLENFEQLLKALEPQEYPDNGSGDSQMISFRNIKTKAALLSLFRMGTPFNALTTLVTELPQTISPLDKRVNLYLSQGTKLRVWRSWKVRISLLSQCRD